MLHVKTERSHDDRLRCCFLGNSIANNGRRLCEFYHIFVRLRPLILDCIQTLPLGGPGCKVPLRQRGLPEPGGPGPNSGSRRVTMARFTPIHRRDSAAPWRFLAGRTNRKFHCAIKVARFETPPTLLRRSWNEYYSPSFRTGQTSRRRAVRARAVMNQRTRRLHVP